MASGVARGVESPSTCGDGRRHRRESYWRVLGRDPYIRVEGKREVEVRVRVRVRGKGKVRGKVRGKDEGEEG